MDTVKVPLTNGGHTLMDEADACRLAGHRLYRDATGYPATSISGKTVRCHRVVLGAGPCEICDHINGDRLDNRRSNLRVVSRSVNALNAHGRCAGSGYVGVQPVRRGAAYRSRLTVSKRPHCLGHWRSRTIAALLYDCAKRALVTEIVTTNFRRTIAPGLVCRFIAETRGRIFTVVFSRRRDGRQRVMTCRTGVKSPSKGGVPAYCPCLEGLSLVWDVHKQAYRTIPAERVIAIRFAKVNYRIEGNHEKLHAQGGRAA